MSPPNRLLRALWILAPLFGLGFLVWLDGARIQRLEQVAHLPALAAGDAQQRSAPDSGVGPHELILPERNEESFHWLLQTRQMVTGAQLRVRHIDYDNAPAGRDVTTPSPYRWWLGAFAWCGHVTSGRPIDAEIERAAVWSGPVMQALLLLAVTTMVAWQFGRLAAALASLAIATLYPLAGSFYPGLPDHHGLANACALGGILFLLAGISLGAKQHRWFLAAGVVSGLGLWVSVSIQVPVLLALSGGGLFSVWTARPAPLSGVPPPSSPWRLWAISGAATVLAAYLVEYAPVHLGEWRLDSIHPLYAVAWLAIGELLHQMDGARSRGNALLNRRTLAVLGATVAAMATVPIASRLAESANFFAAGLTSTRLTLLPESAVAPNFGAWLLHDGLSLTSTATMLPLLSTIPGVYLLLRRTTDSESRQRLALALGPVVVAFVLAWARLEWWSTLDVAIVAFVVATAAALRVRESVGEQPGVESVRSRPTRAPLPGARARWILIGAVGLSLGLGFFSILPRQRSGLTLTRAEAEQWVERDLALWLGQHADAPAVTVLAPPATTTSFCYFGGLRGLGTLSADNVAGITASLRIVRAKSLYEARTVLEGHGVTYLVFPSWDPFFDEYVEANSTNADAIFLTRLERGNIPLWLRPIAYPAPKLTGFEDLAVRVFAVVEEQTEPLATSRLAEFRLESGNLESAAEAERQLRAYPGNLGALVARGHVLLARNEMTGFSEALAQVVARVSSGGDRTMPWDRRVSLALLLARAKRVDLARPQLQRCFAEMTAARVRSLSTATLYHLLGEGRAFDFQISDPTLRELALRLLPPASRAQVH